MVKPAEDSKCSRNVPSTNLNHNPKLNGQSQHKRDQPGTTNHKPLLRGSYNPGQRNHNVPGRLWRKCSGHNLSSRPRHHRRSSHRPACNFHTPFLSAIRHINPFLYQQHMWSSLECVPKPPLNQRRSGGKGSVPVDSATVRPDPTAQSQVHLRQHDHHQSVPHHGRSLRVRNRRIHTARASNSGARDVQQGQLLRRERQDRQH